jgi:hypothetical protein
MANIGQESPPGYELTVVEFAAGMWSAACAADDVPAGRDVDIANFLGRGICRNRLTQRMCRSVALGHASRPSFGRVIM